MLGIWLFVMPGGWLWWWSRPFPRLEQPKRASRAGVCGEALIFGGRERISKFRYTAHIRQDEAATANELHMAVEEHMSSKKNPLETT
mmetsp:Transcript_13056/g.27101  ORF Transcript_13056/g.27101 Transcript_13056/m.27101 type:complete len:87 (-) Transcript_13056:146-406(-)